MHLPEPLYLPPSTMDDGRSVKRWAGCHCLPTSSTDVFVIGDVRVQEGSVRFCSYPLPPGHASSGCGGTHDALSIESFGNLVVLRRRGMGVKASWNPCMTAAVTRKRVRIGATSGYYITHDQAQETASDREGLFGIDGIGRDRRRRRPRAPAYMQRPGRWVSAVSSSRCTPRTDSVSSARSMELVDHQPVAALLVVF